MRHFAFISLLLCTLLFSCKKGKKLPETIYVHYDDVELCAVSPNDDEHTILLYNADFPYQVIGEETYPAENTNAEDSDDLADHFNSWLKDYLKKNNVILTSDPAEYTLKITSLWIGEDIDFETYADSCTGSMEKKEHFSLNSQVKASLYKNGGLVESWERNANATSVKRPAFNKCNRPKYSGPARGPFTLVKQLSKELRVRVSKKIYDLEVD